MKFPQECHAGCIIIVDVLNQKKINDPSVQAMFKISRHNNLSTFIFSQDNFELPKRTIRANGKFHHIFEPNNYGDLQNLYQDKASIDMTLNEFKLITSTCWNEKYRPRTIDLTKNK